MEPIANNEFLNSVLEAEAWKEISDHESFSMEMLEKYADKLDWEEISENSNIIWTLDGITKYANRLNWIDFTRYCPDTSSMKLPSGSLPTAGTGRQSQIETASTTTGRSSKSSRTRQTGTKLSRTGILKNRWSFSHASTDTSLWPNSRIPVSGAL